MNFKEIRWEFIEWIHLAQEMDLRRWQRNFRFHKMQETSLLVHVLPSQQELFSMNFVIQLADSSHYAYFSGSYPSHPLRPKYSPQKSAIWVGPSLCPSRKQIKD